MMYYTILQPIKKLSLLLLLLLCGISLSYAENGSGTIQGQIIDEENNEALEFVSVALYGKADKKLVTG
ncbi:MAG: hypothetical protein KTR26_10675, partial [Flammeovirgaceae bacterium]|nr:hypothetical protein [Flammeovirgaceae bacterium]